MRCQNCGSNAPTRQVVFSQNIGLFVLRFPSSVQGAFCKRCIHRFFWKMTLTSLVAGWWGIISFFTNIFFIFNNIVTYIDCLGMPAGGGVPSDLKAPEEVSVPVSFSTERIGRFKEEIQTQLAAGESLLSVCEKIARRASVPECDVEDFIRQHIQRATDSA